MNEESSEYISAIDIRGEYHRILEKIKGGKIYGKDIDPNNPIDVAVAAYFLSPKERGLSAIIEANGDIFGFVDKEGNVIKTTFASKTLSNRNAGIMPGIGIGQIDIEFPQYGILRFEDVREFCETLADIIVGQMEELTDSPSEYELTGKAANMPYFRLAIRTRSNK
jgi:hypothetical protein